MLDFVDLFSDDGSTILALYGRRRCAMYFGEIVYRRKMVRDTPLIAVQEMAGGGILWEHEGVPVVRRDESKALNFVYVLHDNRGTCAFWPLRYRTLYGAITIFVRLYFSDYHTGAQVGIILTNVSSVPRDSSEDSVM